MDYSLRPKLAYYAIKRELQPITIAIQRIVVKIPADRYTRAHVRTMHSIGLRAVNLCLDVYEV